MGIFNSDIDKISHLISAMEETKVRRSLLLIIGSWKEKEEDDFKNNLDMTQNMWFYMAHVASDTHVKWKEVITLRTGYTINQLKFLNGSLKVKEEYDLNGLKVRATSLTWAPFLTIDDCNDEGLECAQYYGYLKDYMDAMATELNFTYDTYKDLNNDWGTSPKSGPYNLSGTWGGVMGDVVTKKFDLSLSGWVWTI